MTRPAILVLFFLVLSVVVRAESAAGGGRNDAYLEGYVTAVVEHEFGVTPLEVRAVDGRVRIVLPSETTVETDRLHTVVSAIEAVESVEVVAETEAEATAASPAPTDEESEEHGTQFLPRGHLFAPLLADPRWPRFNASYQYYVDDSELTNVAAVALGGEFPILRWDGPAEGRMQLGLHGGISSIFDLDADSFDLVNADYRIGLPVTYERGDLSAMARIFHQSSHLGDEFLLRNRVERINLSFEAIELLASHRFLDALRLYGGGGFLCHQDPDDLDPWWAQSGVEVVSPRTVLFDAIRPVAAVDLQFHDESDWDADVSVVAGVQLESPRLETQRIHLLVEYYSGRNANGQFFERDTEYTGIGLQGHF